MIEATDQSLLVPPVDTTGSGVGVHDSTNTAAGPNVSGAANAAQAAAAQPGMTPPPQEAPAPAPAKRSLLGDIVSAVGGILGGPSTRREVDPKTGAVNEVPRSRASRIGNAAGILLRGAAAGVGAHPGPGFVGMAAAAGMQEEQGIQQQQQQNLMQESENVRQTNQANQQQQLVQASLAKSNQDIARTTLQMRAEKQALDEHQVAIANSLQGIANLPGALKLAHFDSNADINSHLEQVGADLSSKYAVDMAKNEIRLVPSPSGGFDAYQVPKDWHSLPVGDGQKVHVVKYGSDKAGKPTAQMQEIAAPQSMNWGDQQQWESEQFKTLAGFNASQVALKASEAESKLKGAQTGAAFAEAREKTASAKQKEQQLMEQGDMSLSGPEYLATLKGGFHDLVNEMGTGKMPMTRMEYLIARKPEIAAAVSRAFPDFDGSKVKSYVDTYKDFTSGKTSTQLNSGGTALKHLKELYDLNTSASHIPHTPAWTRYQNKAATVSTELAKFYGDATIPAIAKIEDTLTSTLPGNREAAIRTQATSMGDKLDSYEQQWKNAAPSAAYEAPMPKVDDAAKFARAALDPNYASNLHQPKAASAPPEGATNPVFAPDGKTVTGYIVNGVYVPQ